MLGIIAGNGALPLQLAEACHEQRKPFFILGFEGAADMTHLAHLPHAVVRLGAVGDALRALRDAGVTELVLAGSIKRPPLSALRPDIAATRLLARLGSAFFSGDDNLLRAIVAFLEDEGFTVVGADDIMGNLLAPQGPIGTRAPDMRAQEDIALGLKAAKALGALDIGQAVIVENGYVLGVEAAEGTDALIERCANLKREQGAGVLVKVKKPSQEVRVDLPTIGPATVERAHRAGLAGIAVESAGALLLQREKLSALADDYGMFVVGL